MMKAACHPDGEPDQWLRTSLVSDIERIRNELQDPVRSMRFRRDDDFRREELKRMANELWGWDSLDLRSYKEPVLVQPPASALLAPCKCPEIYKKMFFSGHVDMSMELLDWLECYNEWRRSVNGDGPQWFFYRSDDYPGGPPPIPERGDPAARARVKADGPLQGHVRTAEMAIEFFNKNNPGADYEVVELVSAKSIYDMVLCEHINFKAKPKSASAGEDDQSLRSFFAEWLNDDWEQNGGLRWKVTEGRITACCLLEQGCTKNYCRYCFVEMDVLHPLQGFYCGADVPPCLWM